MKDVHIDADVASTALDRILSLVPHWIGGSPLSELQSIVSTKSKGKCDEAREWGSRLAPELAYFFGLVAQIYRRNLSIDNDVILPLSFATHGRCFREGFDSPDKFALHQILGGLYPRVAVHRRYEEIVSFITPAPESETLSDAVARVRRALRKSEGHR
jgi:hypothetical protein